MNNTNEKLEKNQINEKKKKKSDANISQQGLAYTKNYELKTQVYN